MAKIHFNAYDFSFKSNNGEPLLLSQFEGKVILIVNTASKCGFTKQYKQLQALYAHYEKLGFIVIGVPSNDFRQQEPGTNQDIQDFCQTQFGITFPVVQKETVTGQAAHPFYTWAKKALGFGTAPKWNFHKYLVNRNGKLVDYFNSTTSPDSKRFKLAIETLLNESL